MIQRFFAFATLLAVFALPAAAQQRITFDGTWWQNLSHDEKISAVQGMLVAFEGARQVGIVDACLKYYPKTYKTCMTKVPVSPVLDLTFGSYVDRIDAVYREHPALLHWRVSTFVPCTVTYGQGCGELATTMDRSSSP